LNGQTSSIFSFTPLVLVLDGGFTHIEEQTVLQVVEQESETVDDRQEIEFNTELLLDTSIDNAGQKHKEKHHFDHGENVKVKTIFIANRSD